MSLVKTYVFYQDTRSSQHRRDEAKAHFVTMPPHFCASLLCRVLLVFFGIPQLVAQKPITLDDCFVYFKFYPESSKNFQYLRDGYHAVEAEGSSLRIFDVLDEQKDSSIKLDLPADLKEFDQFELSGDEQKLLLRSEMEPVYRHSVLAKYHFYDLKNHRGRLISKEKIQYIAFSPSNEDVAYVQGNNIFIQKLSSGQNIQVTSDGEKNAIINGLADWVYEEEFSPVDGHGMVALQWSPDGSKLAFIRFDEREVPEITMRYYEGDNYPRSSKFKYPKVGEANSKVSVNIFDYDNRYLMGTVDGLEQDDYIPRLHWTPENKLVLTRVNRNQDTLELLVAMPERSYVDPDDHKSYVPCRLMLRETDPAYIELEFEGKLSFLKKNGAYLWTSERSGWHHIYLYETLRADSKSKDLTPGNFEVTAFYGVDEANGKFYFQAATPTPKDRQVWEGDLLSEKSLRLLTPRTGTNDAEFSPTFDYFTHTWQDANTPPVVNLCNRSGLALRNFTDNARVRAMQQEHGFSKKEFFTVPNGQGDLLNAWVIKPPNFDSTRRYPVLYDVYGGPGSQTVLDKYDGYWGPWHQYLAQRGYVVVSVDNRGTGGRGRDFRKCTQLQLGRLETEDQIASARHLGSLPWADPSRIGIWGWSFGGYLSSSCILKGNDVFKMAMAVAPVTNWKWYNSAYTERYMRNLKSNQKGYEDNSPINFAAQLRGDNYLICHGMADDNVHWQQSVEMMDALINANKSFESHAYPNRNHGIYGDNATKHLFTKLSNFIAEKL
jgi:dipeptidyl-peptidase 4